MVRGDGGDRRAKVCSQRPGVRFDLDDICGWLGASSAEVFTLAGPLSDPRLGQFVGFALVGSPTELAGARESSGLGGDLDGRIFGPLCLHGRGPEACAAAGAWLGTRQLGAHIPRRGQCRVRRAAVGLQV